MNTKRCAVAALVTLTTFGLAAMAGPLCRMQPAARQA